MDSLLLSLSPTCTFYITSYTSTASAAVQRSPPRFLTYKRKTPSSDCSSSRLDSCLVNTRGRGGLRLPRQLLSLVARVLGAVRSPIPFLARLSVSAPCLADVYPGPALGGLGLPPITLSSKPSSLSRATRGEKEKTEIWGLCVSHQKRGTAAWKVKFGSSVFGNTTINISLCSMLVRLF